eukprot:2362611-Pyramimonas_sp.AAC.1
MELFVMARNALNVFVRRIRKYIGSFLVALDGGLDALVFTAGIGENSALVRQMVCEGLGSLGLKLDPARNNEVPSHDGPIRRRKR